LFIHEQDASFSAAPSHIHSVGSSNEMHVQSTQLNAGLQTNV